MLLRNHYVIGNVWLLCVMTACDVVKWDCFIVCDGVMLREGDAGEYYPPLKYLRGNGVPL